MIEDVATAQRDSFLPLPAVASSMSFSRAEKLLGHFIVFVIGSWNLIVVGLARGSGLRWMLIATCVWMAVLLGHGLIVAVCSFRDRRLGDLPAEPVPSVSP